jgi:hypothetical protein
VDLATDATALPQDPVGQMGSFGRVASVQQFKLHRVVEMVEQGDACAEQDRCDMEVQ